jgi:hypothetical protein
MFMSQLLYYCIYRIDVYLHSLCLRFWRMVSDLELHLINVYYVILVPCVLQPSGSRICGIAACVNLLFFSLCSLEQILNGGIDEILLKAGLPKRTSWSRKDWTRRFGSHLRIFELRKFKHNSGLPKQTSAKSMDWIKQINQLWWADEYRKKGKFSSNPSSHLRRLRGFIHLINIDLSSVDFQRIQTRIEAKLEWKVLRNVDFNMSKSRREYMYFFFNEKAGKACCNSLSTNSLIVIV